MGLLFKKKLAQRTRTSLAAVDAELIAARAACAAGETRIARLQGIVAAVAPAEADLAEAVDGDAGAALAELTAPTSAPLARLVAGAETARRAAGVAQAALPRAEADLKEAQGKVSSIEARKKAAVGEVLTGEADAIASKYRQTFEQLCLLHDELVAYSRGIARAGFATVSFGEQPIEAPRFRLPSMPGGDVFSPYLRHVPHDETIARLSLAWSRFAGRLLIDNEAVFEPVSEIEVISRAEPLRIVQRLRPPEPTVTEVLYGPDSARIAATAQAMRRYDAAG